MKISVIKAIRRGQLIVNLPVMFIISSCMFLGLYLISNSPLIGVIVFAAGFPLGWLYWSISIVRWKLWAYENVDDLVGLKNAAVTSYLIWPDDSIFNKTEIKSKKQFEKEKQLLKDSNAQFVKTKSPLLDWRIFAAIAILAFASTLVKTLF